MVDKLSRREKMQLTRQTIYDSARELFGKYGLDAVSVDDIVQRANVAKGSFYVHFESRDALLVELITEQVRAIDLNYVNFIDELPVDMPIADQLIKLIEKVAYLLNHELGHERMRILFRIQLERSDEIMLLLGYDQGLFRSLSSLLDKWLKVNEISDEIDGMLLAKQFLILYRGLIYEWCLRYPEIDLKKQSVLLYSVVLDGIKHRYCVRE